MFSTHVRRLMKTGCMYFSMCFFRHHQVLLNLVFNKLFRHMICNIPEMQSGCASVIALLRNEG